MCVFFYLIKALTNVGAFVIFIFIKHRRIFMRVSTDTLVSIACGASVIDSVDNHITTASSQSETYVDGDELVELIDEQDEIKALFTEDAIEQLLTNQPRLVILY
jgi:hypothetical protein